MNDALTAVRLALQTALLGEITPEVVAVAAEAGAKRLVVRVYTDGPASARFREDFDSSVMTQLHAAAPFGADYAPEIDAEFVVCAAGSRVPNWGVLVYHRAL